MPSFVSRLASSLLLTAALLAPAARADEPKVLRLGLPDIAILDPQQITDLYSRRVADVIFEGLYEFDYLASPARVVPNTAVALPEITDGGRTWTIRIKPGILFTDDPAFKGKPRELVAGGLRLLDQAPARSEPEAGRRTRAHRPAGRRAPGRRRGEEVRPVRLRRERSRACRRSIATRCA